MLWDKLVHRYDKKPHIRNLLLVFFFALQNVSASRVTGLRKLTDGADESIRLFHALGCDQRDPYTNTHTARETGSPPILGGMARMLLERRDNREFLFSTGDALEFGQSTPKVNGNSSLKICVVARKFTSKFRSRFCKGLHHTLVLQDSQGDREPTAANKPDSSGTKTEGLPAGISKFSVDSALLDRTQNMMPTILAYVVDRCVKQTFLPWPRRLSFNASANLIPMRALRLIVFLLKPQLHLAGVRKFNCNREFRKTSRKLQF